MLLSDLFRQLSFGELSNLAISNSGSGTIVEAKHPQLIHYTNDALVKIFTRFVLSEKEVIIEQMTEVTEYHLKAKHSESVGTEANLYIIDTAEDPFQDNIAIRITEVWGAISSESEQHVKMPLNDTAHPYSLFTPAPLVLQVPEPVDGEPLAIIYQAYHPKLIDVPVEPEVDISLDQEIDIPRYLEDALQKHIAHSVFSHMNGAENVAKGAEYLSDYERCCQEIENKDLASQSWHTSHTKLEQRGFV